MTAGTGLRGELLVALYGRSLILAGVARRLARHPNLRVVAIDGPTLAGALGPLASDVLIVDLEAVTLESALAVLSDHRDLLLVGLEASGARLLVLSGELAGSVGTDDLVALIHGRERTAERCGSGNTQEQKQGDGETVSQDAADETGGVHGGE